MSLKEYQKKRNFKNTSEPSSDKESEKDLRLRFVVQRHHASRLHYDFRLEMEGVLKSWAVPKGPSLDPQDKRLAMMVEDHPYDYKDFEGVIPEGNYGAGVVYQYDEGFYEPIKKSTNPEKELLNELKAGSLKFILKGKKLKGEFALVKMKNKEDNSWLLIKHNDKYAKDEFDIESTVPQKIKKQKNNTKKAAAKKSSPATKKKSGNQSPAKK